MRPGAEAVMARSLPPWAVAVLTHAVCTAAVFGVAASTPAFLQNVHWTWCEGIAAAAGGAVAGLAPWWLPINLLFAPAAAGLLAVDVPAWIYLCVFGLLAAVNIGAVRQRVPLFLSSAQVVDALRGVMPAYPRFRMIDLGCGVGSLLASIAHVRPDGIYYGIELSPLSTLIAWWRNRGQSAIDVAWGDFWRVDLKDYDVVYAYLSPAPMARLWHKAVREMRPGSVFISNTFAVPGVPPHFEIEVGDRMRSTLYGWRMQGK